MIDPITAGVVIVLGKYALDKGVELSKEVGPAAAQKAGELFNTALERLRRDPSKKVIAERFVADPQKAAPLLEDDLAAVMEADPDFAAQMKQLWEAYNEEAGGRGTTYSATVKGGGAIAQGTGAKALGERAQDFSGSKVGGSIVTGSVRTKGDFVGRDKIAAGGADLQQALEALLAELKAELEKVPLQHQEEAEAILDAAETLAEKALAEKPNRTAIQISGEGLKKAAENLKAVMPTVLHIAIQIVEAIRPYLPQ